MGTEECAERRGAGSISAFPCAILVTNINCGYAADVDTPRLAEFLKAKFSKKITKQGEFVRVYFSPDEPLESKQYWIAVCASDQAVRDEITKAVLGFFKVSPVLETEDILRPVGQEEIDAGVRFTYLSYVGSPDPQTHKTDRPKAMVAIHEFLWGGK